MNLFKKLRYHAIQLQHCALDLAQDLAENLDILDEVSQLEQIILSRPDLVHSILEHAKSLLSQGNNEAEQPGRAGPAGVGDPAPGQAFPPTVTDRDSAPKAHLDAGDVADGGDLRDGSELTFRVVRGTTARLSAVGQDSLSAEPSQLGGILRLADLQRPFINASASKLRRSDDPITAEADAPTAATVGSQPTAAVGQEAGDYEASNIDQAAAVADAMEVEADGTPQTAKGTVQDSLARDAGNNTTSSKGVRLTNRSELSDLQQPSMDADVSEQRPVPDLGNTGAGDERFPTHGAAAAPAAAGPAIAANTLAAAIAKLMTVAAADNEAPADAGAESDGEDTAGTDSGDDEDMKGVDSSEDAEEKDGGDQPGKLLYYFGQPARGFSSNWPGTGLQADKEEWANEFKYRIRVHGGSTGIRYLPAHKNTRRELLKYFLTNIVGQLSADGPKGFGGADDDDNGGDGDATHTHGGFYVTAAPVSTKAGSAPLHAGASAADGYADDGLDMEQEEFDNKAFLDEIKHPEEDEHDDEFISEGSSSGVNGEEDLADTEVEKEDFEEDLGETAAMDGEEPPRPQRVRTRDQGDRAHVRSDKQDGTGAGGAVAGRPAKRGTPMLGGVKETPADGETPAGLAFSPSVLPSGISEMLRELARKGAFTSSDSMSQIEAKYTHAALARLMDVLKQEVASMQSQWQASKAKLKLQAQAVYWWRQAREAVVSNLAQAGLSSSRTNEDSWRVELKQLEGRVMTVCREVATTYVDREDAFQKEKKKYVAMLEGSVMRSEELKGKLLAAAMTQQEAEALQQQAVEHLKTWHKENSDGEKGPASDRKRKSRGAAAGGKTGGNAAVGGRHEGDRDKTVGDKNEEEEEEEDDDEDGSYESSFIDDSDAEEPGEKVEGMQVEDTEPDLVLDGHGASTPRRRAKAQEAPKEAKPPAEEVKQAGGDHGSIPDGSGNPNDNPSPAGASAHHAAAPACNGPSDTVPAKAPEGAAEAMEGTAEPQANMDEDVLLTRVYEPARTPRKKPSVVKPQEAATMGSQANLRTLGPQALPLNGTVDMLLGPSGTKGEVAGPTMYRAWQTGGRIVAIIQDGFYSVEVGKRQHVNNSRDSSSSLTTQPTVAQLKVSASCLRPAMDNDLKEKAGPPQLHKGALLQVREKDAEGNMTWKPVLVLNVVRVYGTTEAKSWKNLRELLPGRNPDTPVWERQGDWAWAQKGRKGAPTSGRGYGDASYVSSLGAGSARAATASVKTDRRRTTQSEVKFVRLLYLQEYLQKKGAGALGSLVSQVSVEELLDQRSAMPLVWWNVRPSKQKGVWHIVKSDPGLWSIELEMFNRVTDVHLLQQLSNIRDKAVARRQEQRHQEEARRRQRQQQQAQTAGGKVGGDEVEKDDQEVNDDEQLRNQIVRVVTRRLRRRFYADIPRTIKRVGELRQILVEEAAKGKCPQQQMRRPKVEMATAKDNAGARQKRKRGGAPAARPEELRGAPLDGKAAAEGGNGADAEDMDTDDGSIGITLSFSGEGSDDDSLGATGKAGGQNLKGEDRGKAGPDAKKLKLDAATRTMIQQQKQIMKQRQDMKKLVQEALSKKMTRTGEVKGGDEGSRPLFEDRPAPKMAACFARNLKQHQVKGLRFMWENLVDNHTLDTLNTVEKDIAGGCILAHSMGLGKTLSTIAFLHMFLGQAVAATHGATDNAEADGDGLQGCRRALLVVPANVLFNFYTEFLFWLPEAGSADEALSQLTVKKVYVLQKDEDDLSKWYAEEGAVLLMSSRKFTSLVLGDGAGSAKAAATTRLQGRRSLRSSQWPSAPVAEDLGEPPPLPQAAGPEDGGDRDPFLTAGDSKSARQHELRCMVLEGAGLVVVDEAHELRNPNSQLYRAMCLLATRRRLALTGYPLQNNLEEYYTMLTWVQGDLLGTPEAFKHEFAQVIAKGQQANAMQKERVASNQRLVVLNEITADFIDRCGPEILERELPPKSEVVLLMDLNDRQRVYYEAYLQELEQLSTSVQRHQLFRDFELLRKVLNNPRDFEKLLEKAVNGGGMSIIQVEDREPGDEDVQFEVTPSRGGGGRAVRRQGADLNTTANDTGGDANLNGVNRRLGFSQEHEPTGTDAAAGPGTACGVAATPAATPAGHAPSAGQVGAKQDGGKSQASKEKKTVQLPLELCERLYRRIKEQREALVAANAAGAAATAEGNGGVDPLWGPLPKQLFVEKLLRICQTTNEKLVVFSQSLNVLNALQTMLLCSFRYQSGREFFRIDGSVLSKYRHKAIDKFNKSQEARVILLSSKAGSLGINLTTAFRMVIFDVSWNPVFNAQAIARIYRFGQTRPTFVYRLLYAATLEEVVYDLNVDKEELFNKVVDKKLVRKAQPVATERWKYTAPTRLPPEAARRRLEDMADPTTAAAVLAAATGASSGGASRPPSNGTGASSGIGAATAAAAGAAGSGGEALDVKDYALLQLAKDPDVQGNLVNAYLHKSKLPPDPLGNLTAEDVRAARQQYQAEVGGNGGRRLRRLRRAAPNEMGLDTAGAAGEATQDGGRGFGTVGSGGPLPSGRDNWAPELFTLPGAMDDVDPALQDWTPEEEAARQRHQQQQPHQHKHQQSGAHAAVPPFPVAAVIGTTPTANMPPSANSTKASLIAAHIAAAQAYLAPTANRVHVLPQPRLSQPPGAATAVTTESAPPQRRQSAPLSVGNTAAVMARAMDHSSQPASTKHPGPDPPSNEAAPGLPDALQEFARGWLSSLGRHGHVTAPYTNELRAPGRMLQTGPSSSWKGKTATRSLDPDPNPFLPAELAADEASSRDAPVMQFAGSSHAGPMPTLDERLPPPLPPSWTLRMQQQRKPESNIPDAAQAHLRTQRQEQQRPEQTCHLQSRPPEAAAAAEAVGVATAQRQPSAAQANLVTLADTPGSVLRQVFTPLWRQGVQEAALGKGQKPAAAPAQKPAAEDAPPLPQMPRATPEQQPAAVTAQSPAVEPAAAPAVEEAHGQMTSNNPADMPTSESVVAATPKMSSHKRRRVGDNRATPATDGAAKRLRWSQQDQQEQGIKISKSSRKASSAREAGNKAASSTPKPIVAAAVKPTAGGAGQQLMVSGIHNEVATPAAATFGVGTDTGAADGTGSGAGLRVAKGPDVAKSPSPKSKSVKSPSGKATPLGKQTRSTDAAGPNSSGVKTRSRAVPESAAGGAIRSLTRRNRTGQSTPRPNTRSNAQVAEVIDLAGDDDED